MNQKKLAVKLLIALTVLAVIVPSCGLAATATKATPAKVATKMVVNTNKVKKFANLKELKNFLEDNITGQTYYYRRSANVLDTWGDAAVPTAAKAESITSGLNTTVAAGSTDYSQTNVQVAGVDEADIVKTDGKYIYAVAKNNLQIIEAYPAESAKILTTIKFENQPQEIYVNGNNLVVYGYNNTIYKTEVYSKFRRQGSYTFLKVFDISDKNKPKEVRTLDFEGNYENSRLVGDYLYFFTNNWNYWMNNDFVLPRVLENGKVISAETNTARYKVPNVYYFDTPYRSANFVTLAAINIKDNTQPITSEVYLMPGGQSMYASENNIYLTYTKYFNEQELISKITIDLIKDKLSAKDKDKLAKIQAADKVVLSDDEKLQKISQLVEKFMAGLSDKEQVDWEAKVEVEINKQYQSLAKELEKTIIHKIAYKNGEIAYKGEAEVYGTVLNQFSMDESNGYFRIATTKNRSWSEFIPEKDRVSYVNLFVLDNNLKQVGGLEGLAKNERIYSARFMGKRAYLVTFEQTDPLFVIDLENPTKPSVLGELKIPGFSQYLHPYDETTLIGLGHETEVSDKGAVTIKGLKVSLFNVADVKNPKEISHYELGSRGSDSIALNDHKAFLFSRDKNLLVIPVYLTKDSAVGFSYGAREFSGAAVFNIDKSGIKLVTKISHDVVGRKATQEYWWNYGYYDNMVKRALYIGDNLYTLSGNYLKVNSMKDWSEVKNIMFEKATDYQIVNPK